MASSTTSSPGFQLGDIYYVLFRHKWKIIICTLLSFTAAAIVYKQQPPFYTSEAKLFIRFIISEGRSDEPGENDSVTVSPDSRGATVINSELQIMTSRDLSEIVARNIGPEKILAGISDSRSVTDAASVVKNGLTAEVPAKSSTVRLAFQHPNPEMAQQVLGEIVKSYLKRHQEIHRAPGMVGDFLAQETDQLRARLAQTEEELRKINQKAGVVTLEDSKKAFADRLTKIRSEIYNTQIELAGRTSIYEQMTKQLPASTTQDAPAAVPLQQIETYQKVVTLLNQLRRREQDLLNYFKEGATRVQEVRAQIAETEAQRQHLLKEFPGLAQVAPAVSQAPGTRPDSFDPRTEAAQITSLQAKIKMLIQQMEETRTELAALEQLESTILDLRRRKQVEEDNYTRYSKSLEQSRIKEAMGDGKVSNISIVQSPTPAYRDWLPIRKLAGGIAAGGLALGLAWAFLIEMFLDRSLRRPAEIEPLLHAPLFISIPKLKLNGRAELKTNKTSSRPALPQGSIYPQTEPNSKTDQLAVPMTKTPDQLALEPFHQTLRDRLMSYFDSINLRHKPKLIAVTGLGRSTGVTTTAAGLARSFSETGEGNVLLVDMTQGQGSAKHFQRGTQVGLDQLLDTRNSAFVRDNLYVVSEHSGGERLAKGMPQRFNQLVPKLKASDFDYIIFDMPPVNQISITPRLAGFMDMTLLVVESEKTDRHVAERAAELLSQSKTNVGVVLNKNKSYVPSKLQQDHEFMLGM